MTRPNELLLGTRKGFLVLERGAAGFAITRATHPGMPVSYATRDRRHGTLWVCLDHGHWGTKLERSSDHGQTWDVVAPPKYPEGAEIKDGVPASTRYLWVLASGGDDRPERLWIGTEPGGLFESDDGGTTFSHQHRALGSPFAQDALDRRWPRSPCDPLDRRRSPRQPPNLRRDLVCWCVRVDR